MELRIIHLRETKSTNDCLLEMDAADDAPDVMTVVVANYQTAGRGQSGNHWESEAGKNLLMSVMTHPRRIPVHQQYLLSMALACALRDVLSHYTDGITIKWPNDIYWHDKKISGTLIETRLKDKEISDCIFGIGINVNQTAFQSDAPNPVSLKNIIQNDTPTQEIMNAVIERLTHYIKMVEDEIASGMAASGNASGTSFSESKNDTLSSSGIRVDYLKNLYRLDGNMYPFEDNDGQFMASITTVLPDGTIVLADSDGQERRYAFKEVKFIVD